MNPVDFLSGAVTLGFLVAALFFLRFWRRARDPLFAAFAAAFALMALHQTAFSLLGAAHENIGHIYLLRFAAYLIIIAAIAAKNLGARR